MNINKKPKTFGTWLTMKMLLMDVEDKALARAIFKTIHTIQGWKSNKNLPKMDSILKIVDFVSQRTNESPSDVMDELLDSIHQWRDMNKRYRLKRQGDK